MFWFGLDKCQVPTKTALSLLLCWTGEREYDERLEGRDKDRERSLTNYCHRQNRLNLGTKKSLIYHQSNQSIIMRKKTKSYNTFPPPFPSSRAQLHCRFSPSSPRAVQGDGEWGLWSVHHTLSLPLLPPQGEDSSHSALAPAWGSIHGTQFSTNFSNMSPSLGRQSFTNCPSMGPFHRVQSFRNRLLQRESPTESPALPANLLQRGVLSPWLHRSCQEPASVQAPHRVTAFFGHTHLFWHGVLPGLHCGPPWTAGGQPASPWSSSWAAEEKSLLLCLEHLLPLLLH